MCFAVAAFQPLPHISTKLSLLHPEYWSYLDMNSTGIRDIPMTQHRQQESPKPEKQHGDIQALTKQKEFDFQSSSAGAG